MMPQETAAPIAAPTSDVGNLIRKQREAMQMTVAHLARLVGVSRNTLTNYESSKTEPSASHLVRLSNELGCTINDLLYVETASIPPRFAFRAHTALRKNPSITVAAQKYLRAYNEIEETTNSRLPNKLRLFNSENGGPLTDREIEMAADTLRQTSGLHDTGPENIARVLECLGVRTLFFEHECKGLDGISTIQGDMVLVMLRDRKKAVERTIFSAVHELGHLALHPQLFTSDDLDEELDIKRYEREADKFAGNFLVPSDELVRIWQEERLNKLTLFNALIQLKGVFHVSFHCLYRRVTELGLQTGMDRGIFMNQIKQQLGYKMSEHTKMEDLEPEPLNPDVLYRTTRFERLIQSAFLQELIGVAKVAEMLQVTVDKAQEITSNWLRPQYELVEDGSL